MADHGAPVYSTAKGNDYPAHENTYEGVMALSKIGTASVIAILVCMYVGLIAHASFASIVGAFLVTAATVIGLFSKNKSIVPLAGAVVITLLLWALTAG
jgi:hypothetical protein